MQMNMWQFKEGDWHSCKGQLDTEVPGGKILESKI